MSRRETSRPPKSSCATPFAKRRRIRFFTPGSPRSISNSAMPPRRSARRELPANAMAMRQTTCRCWRTLCCVRRNSPNLLDLVKPGDRRPALESKVRTALGAAAAGLRDREKAEALLREAIKLDPSAVRPKIQLARLLTGTKPDEADKFIDEAIAANPHSAEAFQVKGEMLRSRGDQEGAMRLFDEALKIDPKNVLAHLSRANVNISSGQIQGRRRGSRPHPQVLAEQFHGELPARLGARQTAEICRGGSHRSIASAPLSRRSGQATICRARRNWRSGNMPRRKPSWPNTSAVFPTISGPARLIATRRAATAGSVPGNRVSQSQSSTRVRRTRRR